MKKPKIWCGLESALKRRRRGHVIRLDFDASMPEEFRRFVMQEFDGVIYVFLHRRMLGITDIAEIIVDERRDLQYGRMALSGACSRVWRQHFCRDPRERFRRASSLRSFDVVAQFLRQATRDPAVVAIKQTLYRTSDSAHCRGID